MNNYKIAFATGITALSALVGACNSNQRTGDLMDPTFNYKTAANHVNHLLDTKLSQNGAPVTSISEKVGQDIVTVSKADGEQGFSAEVKPHPLSCQGTYFVLKLRQTPGDGKRPGVDVDVAQMFPMETTNTSSMCGFNYQDSPMTPAQQLDLEQGLNRIIGKYILVPKK